MSKYERKQLRKAQARRGLLIVEVAVGSFLLITGAIAVWAAFALPASVLKSPWLTFLAKAVLFTLTFATWRKTAAIVAGLVTSKRR